MTKFIKFIFFLVATVGLIAACSTPKNSVAYKYVPDDQRLHDSIFYLDSVFFNAYNTCTLNLDKYAAFYSDSIEFYHDKGGLMNSKQEIVDATKKNICGKVNRELVKGSIEVYPIKDYGAVEIGLHKFHNLVENSTSRPGKFIIFWQHKNNEWKITKVVSLH